MNPVVHFELPYKDESRISNFYAETFGWQLTPLGEKSGNYVLAQTATSDVKPGAPAGSIDGGFFPYKPDWPMQHPSVVIGVGNIETAMKAIEANGGIVLGDPIYLPNFGHYVSFMDTEGNRNSILHPDAR
jgi:predicted enzyme related to lactoylglutathione lyase